MKRPSKARALKNIRLMHAWLAIIVLPWIFMIGITGFYLNHSKAINPYLEATPYDEAQFNTWPTINMDSEQAFELAQSIWPGEEVTKFVSKNYHARLSYIMDLPSGQVIVSKTTGHYFTKEGFTRETYTPDGTLLHSKLYWGFVFKRLHTRGWLTHDLGTWLADITSFALVFFALSGLYLWWAPRKNRMLRTWRRK